MYYDLKSAIKYFPLDVSQKERVIRTFAENKIKLTNIEIKDSDKDNYSFEMNGNMSNLKLLFRIKSTFGQFSNAIEDMLSWELYGFQKEDEIVKLTVPVKFTINNFYKLDFNELIIKLLVEPNIYKYYYNQFKSAISENEHLVIKQDLRSDNGEFTLECENGLFIRVRDSDINSEESRVSIIFPKEQGIKIDSLYLYYDERLIKTFLNYLKTGSITVDGFNIIRLMTFVNTHKAFECIKFENLKLNLHISENQMKKIIYPNIDHFLFKGHFQNHIGLIFPIEMSIATNLVFKIKVDSQDYTEKFVRISDFEAFIEELYNL